jgi:hypothetical protein
MQESSELSETSFAIVRANDPSDGALNAEHRFFREALKFASAGGCFASERGLNKPGHGR